MNIDLNQLYFFLLILAVFMVFLAIFVAYYRLFVKYTRLEDKSLKDQNEFNQKTSEVIVKAHEDYIKIIQEANLKARDIMEGAILVKIDAKKTLDIALKKLSEEQNELIESVSEGLVKDYKNHLDDVQKNNIKILSNLSKGIESYTKTQLDDYKKVIQEETLDSQKILGQKIETEFNQIQAELNSYKTAQLQKTDEQYYKLLENILKIILKESISIEQHENLVVEALEEAKKQIKTDQTINK